jgi:hypothetical protein
MKLQQMNWLQYDLQQTWAMELKKNDGSITEIWEAIYKNINMRTALIT